MAELKLQKRYKYAGDIMPKLLDIGFDLETASDFLNSIPDADVAPRAEVAREIFEEVENILNDERINRKLAERGFLFVRHGEPTFEQRFAELKNKYAEGEK